MMSELKSDAEKALKPCGCGGKVEIVNEAEEINVEGGAYVEQAIYARCCKCLTMTSPWLDLSEEKAIKVWNAHIETRTLQQDHNAERVDETQKLYHNKAAVRDLAKTTAWLRQYIATYCILVHPKKNQSGEDVEQKILERMDNTLKTHAEAIKASQEESK